MELGLTLPVRGLSVRSMRELIARAHEFGFTELWTAEVNGLDGTALLAASLDSGMRHFGTAIMSVYRWSPIAMASTACALHDLTGGRFILGLGSSSPKMVANWTGSTYRRPMERLHAYVETMRAVSEGAAATVSTDEISVRNLSIVPQEPRSIPILLAAMGPRSAALAGELADGAIMNMVTYETLAGLIETVHAGSNSAKRQVFRVLASAEDSADSKQVVRRHLATYDRVPAYRDSFRRQGLDLATDSPQLADLMLSPTDESLEHHLVSSSRAGVTSFVVAPFADAQVPEDTRLARIARLLEQLTVVKTSLGL